MRFHQPSAHAGAPVGFLTRSTDLLSRVGPWARAMAARSGSAVVPGKVVRHRFRRKTPSPAKTQKRSKILPPALKKVKSKFATRKSAQKEKVAASGASSKGKQRTTAALLRRLRRRACGAAREDQAIIAGQAAIMAACGAKARARGHRGSKVRAQGLFALRHWIHPSDLDAFANRIEELRSEFEGQGSIQKTVIAYKRKIKALLNGEFHRPRAGGPFVESPRPASALATSGVPPEAAAITDISSRASSHAGNPEQLGAASGAPSSPGSGGAPSPRPESQPGSPASGGTISTDLKDRLNTAFKPLEKVHMRTPSGAPGADYINRTNAALVYMQPQRTTGSAKDIRWLPQEAADWLYQATHYSLPLLQTLLGTNQAFNRKGQYLNAKGEPASGGQLAAFWGTELGSRRDRALIAYDCDVDFEVFVTPCCDFSAVWSAATPIFESLDLSCSVTSPGKYYRISPKCPLTSNDWREWCHEARQEQPQNVSRHRVLVLASAKKAKGDPPVQPIGPHFIDFGVKVVTPNTPVKILQGAASGADIAVEPHALFPIVEGFFGPLRIPLPATTAALDAYYGDAWRTKYAIKSIGGKYIRILDEHCRRTIHPAVPLKGCPTYLECFAGASCNASSTDVSWRWL